MRKRPAGSTSNLLLRRSNQKRKNYLVLTVTIREIAKGQATAARTITRLHVHTLISARSQTWFASWRRYTDHFPTFVIASNTTKANNNRKPIFQRNMKKFNSEKFEDDVFKTLSPFYNCSKHLTTDNFNSLFANFISNYKTVIDKHAPMKKLSQKQTKLLSKPWITKGILVSIRKKQKMYVTHFKNGDYKQKTF